MREPRATTADADPFPATGSRFYRVIKVSPGFIALQYMINLLQKTSLCAIAMTFVPSAEAAVLVNITRPAVFDPDTPVQVFPRQNVLVGWDNLRGGGNIEKFIDLDRDGQNDIRFYGPTNGLGIEVFGNTEVLVSSINPRFLDPQTDVIPLLTGSILMANAPQVFGASLLEPRWLGSDSPLLHVLSQGAGSRPGEIGGSFAFIDEHTYVGLRLLQDDGYHYAWVQIDEFQGSYGALGGWAYETEPDRAIVLGVIPEPSVTSVVLLSLWVFSLKRKR